MFELTTQIRAAFTQTVMEYFSKGFFIFPDTMGGTQGEIAKVDMCKDTEIIRIFLEHDMDVDFCDRVILTVGKVPADVANRILAGFGDTIWNSKLETISQRYWKENVMRELLDYHALKVAKKKLAAIDAL